MNPLYRNDRPGAYPPSWYVASTDLPPERPQLRGEVTADVAVLGAGYTGLWAAKAGRAGASTTLPNPSAVLILTVPATTSGRGLK
mgnify:CR=1 FL=1